MRNFDETTITEAVLERVRNAPNPRQRLVSEAMVRHLHDFVREVEPSQKEWVEAIGFLTRVGQKCTDTRQEFILLSDTLGVSMLVDAINHRFPGNATQTTVLGPFHVADAPEFALGDDISGVSQARRYLWRAASAVSTQSRSPARWSSFGTPTRKASMTFKVKPVSLVLRAAASFAPT